MKPSLCNNSVNTKHTEGQQGDLRIRPITHTHKHHVTKDQLPACNGWGRGATTGTTWEKHKQNQMSFI